MTYMTSYNNVTTPMMVVNHYVDTVVHGPCTPGLGQVFRMVPGKTYIKAVSGPRLLGEVGGGGVRPGNPLHGGRQELALGS